KKGQEAELETHDEKRDWLNKCIQIFQELDLEKMQKQVGSMRQFAKLAQTFLNDQNNTSTKWQNVNEKQNLFHIFKDSGKNNDKNKKYIQNKQKIDKKKMQKQVVSMQQFTKLAHTFINDQNNTSTKWQNVNEKQNLFHIFKDSGKNND